MTTTQFCIVLGAIYIAPHANKKYCLAFGCIFLCIAGIMELLT